MTDIRPALASLALSPDERRRNECALECFEGSVECGKHGAVRSDSYSSVKEDLDGEPQSFISKSRGRNDGRDVHSPLPLVPRLAISPVRPTGGLTLESLPAELLDRVMSNLAVDVPPEDFSRRNPDLMACLLTSRKISQAALTVLYRRVAFHHGRVFSKFLKAVEASPELGLMARRMDLSHFTSVGLGRTRKVNGATQDFVNTTFQRCLELLPNLQEILLQEHVDEDTDAAVLEKILFGLPALRALDLCGMSRPVFVDAFEAAVSGIDRGMPNLQNLCLHECFTLHASDIETLLAHLPRLTMLDLHHTRATDKALLSIPPTAALTHLNLGRCTQITGAGVVQFFTQSPAVRGLVYLNLHSDISRYRLLDEEDTGLLLPQLPSSLRSLNLNGAALRRAHVPPLAKLTTHLEELSVAYTSLSMDEITTLVGSHADDNAPPSALRYIDLTGVQAVTQAALFGRASALLSAASRPLEVVELTASLATSLQKAKHTNARLGWAVKEFGRRSWYVRADGSAELDPEREWKMGSRWWGMRKVPVAFSDVGGIYGYYMFKAG